MNAKRHATHSPPQIHGIMSMADHHIEALIAANGLFWWGMFHFFGPLWTMLFSWAQQ
jgi:hypothetical protein